MKKLLIIIAMVLSGCESSKDKIINEQRQIIEMQRAYYDTLQMHYDHLYDNYKKVYKTAKWATDSLINQRTIK
jgi:uncharacterized protein YcfL